MVTDTNRKADIDPPYPLAQLLIPIYFREQADQYIVHLDEQEPNKNTSKN